MKIFRIKIDRSGMTAPSRLHDNFRDDCASPHAPMNLRVDESAGTRMQHPVPFPNRRNWINPCTADEEQSCHCRVRMKAPEGISPDKLSGTCGWATGLPPRTPPSCSQLDRIDIPLNPPWGLRPSRPPGKRGRSLRVLVSECRRILINRNACKDKEKLK